MLNPEFSAPPTCQQNKVWGFVYPILRNFQFSRDLVTTNKKDEKDSESPLEMVEVGRFRIGRNV